MALRRSAHASHAIVGGWLVLGALMAALAALLLTTPPDAIRLPRPRSERLIVSGGVALQVLAVVIASPHPFDARGIGAAFVAVVGTIVILRMLRAKGASAWAAALFAWNPLVVYETGVAGRAIVTIGALAAFVIAIAALRRR